jgi:hypothetical protein
VAAKRQRPVNDVRVAGNPADVRHAPINIFGMNVLVMYLEVPASIGQIAAGAVLAAFGFAGGAAGVHQEKRRFRVLRDGFHDGVTVVSPSKRSSMKKSRPMIMGAIQEAK